ncbi:MAG: tRNA lysidine(34) synthetase TilS [Deltaproteobacteria bacterium]|nr:MAG: tRNA lysidine(34) synthetase TilS [Deltaproteobacteria bacterium]
MVGTLTESVEQAVASGLLPRGKPVLVACSGGADSVALAVAVLRCGLRGAIGHIDHALRPESAREAQQVSELAQRLCAPFFLERLQGLVTRGPGLEAAAREARYAALARLARTSGADVVATAHTRRDQAETLLLRLIRGAGPTALAGIRRRRSAAPGRRLSPEFDGGARWRRASTWSGRCSMSPARRQKPTVMRTGWRMSKIRTTPTRSAPVPACAGCGRNCSS